MEYLDKIYYGLHKLPSVCLLAHVHSKCTLELNFSNFHDFLNLAPQYFESSN